MIPLRPVIPEEHKGSLNTKLPMLYHLEDPQFKKDMCKVLLEVDIEDTSHIVP